MHDPFPDHILRQRLPPIALLQLRRLFRSVLLLVHIRLSGLFFLGRFRIAGPPERLEQRQLFFGELLAFTVSLFLEKFAQQAAVLVLFRTLGLEPVAQIHNNLLQDVDVVRQTVGINRGHAWCFQNNRKQARFQVKTNENRNVFYAAFWRYRLRRDACSRSMPLSSAPSSSVVISMRVASTSPEGMAYVPVSIRFAQIAKPSRSQYRILTLSRRLLEKI